MLKILCAFLSFVSLNVSAEVINIGEKFSIDSKILGEQREYWISLPDSYKKNGFKKYPVFYFLDADQNHFFQTFSGMVKQMGSDASPQIPEMIFVGITMGVGSKRYFDATPTASTDQYGGQKNDSIKTGGASKFLKYLQQELIPHIDTTYSTSSYRLLSGYSVTGMPVIQALYTMPKTFNGYIAVDPSIWFDNHVMLRRTENFIKNTELHKRRLFLASSHRVGVVYPKENYTLELIEKMNVTSKEGLDFGSVIYGIEENHQSMPVLSFYKGLRHIFDGYMIDEETRFRPANELKSHFQKLSEKLGSNFFLNEGLVQYFGYDNLYNTQFGKVNINQAIEYFKLNVENYPESSNAWDSLGEGYLVNGKYTLALSAYKKALELSPNNKSVKVQIEKIELLKQTN
jgi:predicted alpha/beta superfamily hydrolase